jgi:hypothetical protein
MIQLWHECFYGKLHITPKQKLWLKTPPSNAFLEIGLGGFDWHFVQAKKNKIISDSILICPKHVPSNAFSNPNSQNLQWILKPYTTK